MTHVKGLSQCLACSTPSINGVVIIPSISIASITVLTFPLSGLEKQETIANINERCSPNISGSLLLV